MDDPDLGFSALLPHVEVTEGDTIYVHDIRARQFRVHAPDGGLVRRIGRPGEGPGELGSVWGIVQDTLWAIDFQGRLTLFSRDGRLLATTRPEHGLTAWPARAAGVAAGVGTGPPGGRAEL